jgi:hypothetical protein
MQDIGRMEDTELSWEDLTFSWQESRVQFLGRCRYIGNWMFFPRVVRLSDERPIASDFKVKTDAWVQL